VNLKFKIRAMKRHPKNIICSMFHVPCSMKQRGFAIIELAVSLSILLVLVGATVDIFISVVQNQRRLLAEQELLNQTSYAMEYIAKALRVAGEDINQNCLDSGADAVYLLTRPNEGLYHGVKFINQLEGNACEQIFLDISTDPDNPVLRQIKDPDAVTAENILSDKFEVKYAKFIINGQSGLDSGHVSPQPRITILLDVKTRTGGNLEKIIQTTVSRRW